jgi:hypothetical protein
MTIHREIGLSYHYKPIVQGVNYSPLMVESKEEVLVKEERRPAAIPPPIFLRRLPTASFCDFCVSQPPPSADVQGAFK